MEKRSLMMMVFMLMVILAWQNECHGWEAAEDIVRNESEDSKNAAGTVTKMAAKATRDANDKTASWTGWVSDKIST